MVGALVLTKPLTTSLKCNDEYRVFIWNKLNKLNVLNCDL